VAAGHQSLPPPPPDMGRGAATPEEAVRLCEETPLWDANVRRFAAL